MSESSLKSRFTIKSVNRKILAQSLIRDIDIGVAGRKLIEQAKKDLSMVNLFFDENKATQPLKNLKICGSTHITPHYAVLISYMAQLGANVRWCCSTPVTTNDQVAAALVSDGIIVLARSAMTEHEHLECIDRCVTGDPEFVPNIIIDDNGIMTQYIYKNNPTLFSTLKGAIHNSVFGLRLDVESIVHEKRVPIPIFNLTNSSLQKLIRDQHTYNFAIMNCIRSMVDVALAGLNVLVIGYGHKGSKVAKAFRNCGSIVHVSEIDPICAVHALINGYPVVTFDSICDKIHVLISCTNGKDIINIENLRRLRHNSIVLCLSEFYSEIDMDKLRNDPDIQLKANKENTSFRVIFPNDHQVLLIPLGLEIINMFSTIPFCLFSVNILTTITCAIDLWNAPSTKYKAGVYLLSKKMDEYIGSLYVRNKDYQLETLTKDQAEYLGLNTSGPFKPSSYYYN